MRLFKRTRRPVDEIRTGRLRLVAVTPALLDAEGAGRAPLGVLLGAEVPEQWPPQDWSEHIMATVRAQLMCVPPSVGWHRYVVWTAEPRHWLVGCLGGFPKLEGEVELGYSTLPEYQRRGFGSEAAGALVEWLLEQRGVSRVTAQSFVDRPESIKVMQRAGMVFVGEGDEPGTVRYRRARAGSAG